VAPRLTREMPPHNSSPHRGGVIERVPSVEQQPGRLRCVLFGLAGLTLIHAAEAFAPTGGAWLTTPRILRPSGSVAQGCQNRRIHSALGSVMLHTEDNKNDGACHFKKQKTPGFRPSFCTFRKSSSDLRKSGSLLAEEEEVRREVLENTIDSLVQKYDYSVYRFISKSAHSLAQHVPNVKKLASTLAHSNVAFPTHLPPGIDKAIVFLAQSGMLFLVPTFLMVHIVIFLKALLLDWDVASTASKSLRRSNCEEGAGEGDLHDTRCDHSRHDECCCQGC
jgi:hypothetical protein